MQITENEEWYFKKINKGWDTYAFGALDMYPYPFILKSLLGILGKLGPLKSVINRIMALPDEEQKELWIRYIEPEGERMGECHAAIRFETLSEVVDLYEIMYNDEVLRCAVGFISEYGLSQMLNTCDEHDPDYIPSTVRHSDIFDYRWIYIQIFKRLIELPTDTRCSIIHKFFLSPNLFKQDLKGSDLSDDEWSKLMCETWLKAFNGEEVTFSK